MNARQLLAAIASQTAVEVQGTFERHISIHRPETVGSSSGGRWGAPGTFEVLYLGRPEDAVVIEAYRHLVDDEAEEEGRENLASRIAPRRCVTCEVSVSELLDLRPFEAQERLRIDRETLRSPVGEYGRCQAIGAAAHQLGRHGVIAPAAGGLGETLALFSQHLPPDETPKVVSRKLWDGLPADPRRLRLIEDGQAG